MMRARRLVLGLLGLLNLGVLSSCTPDFDTRYSTAHLEIASEFEAPLCAGDLQRWEALVEQLEAWLDVDLEPGLELYLWDEFDWAAGRWCPSWAVGCYSAAQHRIWSTMYAAEHELVHAVAEGLGSNEALFDEGLASALQSDSTSFGGSSPSSNLGLSTGKVDRVTAGHFVRWLWESEGPEKMRELIRSKGRAKDFARIYGFSLAEADQRYFDEAPWRYPPVFVWEVPAVPEVAAQRWEASVDFDCADPSAYGRAGGMAMARTLMIAKRGHYGLWSSADGISIERRQREIVETLDEAREQLAGDIPAEFLVWIPGGKLAIHDLAPGEYELWVTDLDTDLADAEVVVWRHLGPIPTLPEGTP